MIGDMSLWLVENGKKHMDRERVKGEVRRRVKEGRGPVGAAVKDVEKRCPNRPIPA